MSKSYPMALIVGAGCALFAAYAYAVYQRYEQRGSTRKKTALTSLQVWEGEGGNVVGIPTPKSKKPLPTTGASSASSTSTLRAEAASDKSASV